MSWSETLYDASFRGVTFDVKLTDDDADFALATHEIPYVDGADVEGMGRRARHMHLLAVIWGDKYETLLQQLLQALDTPGNGELIHPVFGSIPTVKVAGYRVHHDADNVDACTIDLRFLESTPGNPFFVQQLPSQKAEAVSALTNNTRTSGMSGFSGLVSALSTVQGALARLNSLRDIMTGTLGALRAQVQGVIGTVLDVINYPQAFAADVVSYLSGMADLRSFDVGVIVSDWKSLVGQLSNTVELPGKISSGTATIGSSAGVVPTGITAATSSSVGNGSTGTTGATGSGTSTGSTSSTTSSAPVLPSSVIAVNANAADVAAVQAFVQLAAALQLADTASMILADEASDATLSPADIELITNDTRTAIQAAIDLHRQVYALDVSRPVTESLKDIALAVQTAAVGVLNERPPLTTRTVTLAGNLHLTAFRWYGDYSRADELLRLNPQITNPNFVMPGAVLNAYSR